MFELLTTAQMGEADRLTIEAGTPGIDLMENAGRAVSDAVLEFVRPNASILVACGPGNNGGDGFIAARRLVACGFHVCVALAGDPSKLRGDAALALARWGGSLTPLEEIDPARYDLVVDALLGAGLDRDVGGSIGDFVDRLNETGIPVVSVDLPSGISGNSGAIMGRAVRAVRTVTFFRKKPGHLLMPGRAFCGVTGVAEIGIHRTVLKAIGPKLEENQPRNWFGMFPRLADGGHKYDRGHAIVVSGSLSRTGAARMAAIAALRAGTGLVTLATPPGALAANAAHSTEVMLARMEGRGDLETILSDPRVTAVCLGPALGIGEETRDLVSAALSSNCAAVLDADALTSFEDSPETLFEMIGNRSVSTILTPHPGEFRRLFRFEEPPESKVDATADASRRSGAVVLHKGADSVIAAPDGRSAINANGPPWLATAGSGDVLAGIACAMLAQGVPGFEAAAMAAWLHGAAASEFGPGMIAGDLVESLPSALWNIHQQ